MKQEFKFIQFNIQDIDKMVKINLLATIIVMVYLHDAYSEEAAYSTKYDGVDLNEILTNDRLTAGYINCLLNNGPCSPEAKELKKNVPDAIRNDCIKCSSRQREGADQVLDFIIDHRPEDWEKLEKMYNSDGSYKKKYLARKEKESLIKTAEADEKTDENILDKKNIDEDKGQE